MEENPVSINPKPAWPAPPTPHYDDFQSEAPPSPPPPHPADPALHQPDHQAWSLPTVPPEPPSTPSLTTPHGTDEPVPVVRVLSVRGVEYAMMSIALWFSAASLSWLLLNVFNSSANFDFLVVPISVLITAIPVFGVFFIRLKRAELANPNLRLDASKRRSSQLTQMLAFIVLLINGSVFIYNILQKINDNPDISIGKSLINLAVIMVIAGGVLAYYWFDEHRFKKD